MAEQEPVNLGAPVRSFALNVGREGHWGGQVLLTAAFLLIAAMLAAGGWYVAAVANFVLAALAAGWCLREIRRDMRTTVLTIYEDGIVYDEGRQTYAAHFADIAQAWSERLKYGWFPMYWERVLHLMLSDGQEIRIDWRVANHVRAEALIESRLVPGTLRKPDSSPPR